MFVAQNLSLPPYDVQLRIWKESREVGVSNHLPVAELIGSRLSLYFQRWSLWPDISIGRWGPWIYPSSADSSTFLEREFSVLSTISWRPPPQRFQRPTMLSTNIFEALHPLSLDILLCQRRLLGAMGNCLGGRYLDTVEPFGLDLFFLLLWTVCVLRDWLWNWCSVRT